MKYKFKTKPWEHQLKALNYLYPRDVGALFTDMGTGKTKVMIDLIQNRGFKRVLIVGTKKSCDVWEHEIRIHGIEDVFSVVNLKGLPTSKKVSVLKTIPKVRTVDKHKDTCYVFIINYDSVWLKGVDDFLLRKSLGIDCIICDESHRIKSPGSKCSRYLTKLGSRVPHRYILTGTPLAETPLDAYAQYRFLDPRIFGTNYGAFKEKYENIDAHMTARVGFPIRDKKVPFINLDDLHDKMYSCAFYVESSVELPKVTDIKYPFRMPKKSQRLYKEVLDEGLVELNGKVMETSNALSLLLRLQQLTSGYLPAEDEDGNKKVINLDSKRRDTLKELLEDFPEGEPVVVFATYKKDLKNIRLVCKELGIGYSEVSGSKDTLDDWVKGKTQIIGVQYSSGSESIDLTRARYCIYYSLTRRLSLYEQSRKRIHRPGQTRPVYYYHFIAEMDKGVSIDQKMYEALEQKKDIVKYVMRFGWK